MKRPIVIAILLVACVAMAQTISYYNQQLLTKPSAEADRAFLEITNSAATTNGAFSGTFTGSGAGLTNIPASAIVGGGGGGGCCNLWTNWNNTISPTGLSGTCCSWSSPGNIIYPYP